MRLRTALGSALVLVAPVVLAHDDDGKLRDRQPRLERGAQPAGAAGDPRMTAEYPAQGVTMLSMVTLPEFGAEVVNANDCWGYVSPSGREYALLGLSHGTGFVEVTDSAQPRIVAMIAGPVSLWRDVQVYGQYVYSVSEGGGGIQIIDCTQIDDGTVTLANTVTLGGDTERTHTVIIDEVSGYLYRCGGGSNGLRIYSLADPTNPAFVAEWGDRYVHECQAVTYSDGPYAGRQIVFAFGGFNGGRVETGLDILDVTDKTLIQPMSRLRYADGVFSHQGWLSEDRRYLYINDELDEGDGKLTSTIMVDVSDLRNPRDLGRFFGRTTAIGHNLYLRNHLIYAANYRAGLEVYGTLDPLRPQLLAHFDSYPLDDEPSFNSLWGTYPFLPSGIVLGSDIEQGLFIWKVSGVPASFQLPAGAATQIGESTTIDVEARAVHGFTLASVTLHVDSGEGFVALPMQAVGGNLYRGTFPAASCAAGLRYYFSATATDGTTIAAPLGGADAAFEADYLIADTDADAVPDECDNCPSRANADQADGDADGVGNVCDNCLFASNADQRDTDGDGTGDDCATAAPIAPPASPAEQPDDEPAAPATDAPPVATSDDGASAAGGDDAQGEADAPLDGADSPTDGRSDDEAEIDAAIADDLAAAGCGAGAGACGTGGLAFAPLMLLGLVLAKRRGV